MKKVIERLRLQHAEDLRVQKLKIENPAMSRAGIATKLGWICKSGTLARVKVARVLKRIENQLQVN